MSRLLDPLQRISSLLPKRRLDTLTTPPKHLSVSTASKLPQMSHNPTVSGFLGTKVAAMEAALAWIRCFRDGLDKAKAEQLINDEEFSTEIQPFLSSFKSLSQALKVLKRKKRLIEDDLTEELQVQKHRTTKPDDGHLERAYASTMVARVVTVLSNQEKARSFNQSRFRKEVVEYYNANDPEGGDFVWCHVLGEVSTTR